MRNIELQLTFGLDFNWIVENLCMSSTFTTLCMCIPCAVINLHNIFLNAIKIYCMVAPKNIWTLLYSYK